MCSAALRYTIEENYIKLSNNIVHPRLLGVKWE
jgi:hypothetical protein